MITADELRGTVLKPSTPPNGASTVHRLEGDEDQEAAIAPRSKRADVAARKEAIMVHLEAGPKTSRALARITGEPFDKVGSACVMLSAAGYIERAPKNAGYQLTAKGFTYRKTAQPTPTSTPTQEKPVATKRKNKRRDKAAELTPHVPAKFSAIDASFAVSDSGAITIIGLTQRLELTVTATKRLAVFIDRTKTLRP